MKVKAKPLALALALSASSTYAGNIKDPSMLGFYYEVDKTCQTTYGIQTIAEEINKGATLKDIVAQSAEILYGQKLA